MLQQQPLGGSRGWPISAPIFCKGLLTAGEQAVAVLQQPYGASRWRSSLANATAWYGCTSPGGGGWGSARARGDVVGCAGWIRSEWGRGVRYVALGYG